MLVPLLSVHFTKSLGYSFAIAGILFSIRILAQQGLMLFGGVLGDRLGYREMIALGSMIRAAGFIMFGLVSSLPMLMVASVLAGLGGSLFGPSMSAATTALAKPEEREQVFAWRNILGNAGLTIGPLIGVWMTHYDFFWVTLAAGGIFLIFGIVNWIMVPKIEHVATTHQMTLFQNIHHIVQNRSFVLLTIWLMGYSMLYQQMYIAIPVLAQEYAGWDVSGYFFTALSLMIILGQTPISRWVQHKGNQPIKTMALGMFLMGASFVVPSLHPSLFTLVFPLIGIALGSILIMPSQQMYVSDVAEPDLLGSYFGFSSLSMAIGGTVGNSLGGWVIDVSRSIHWEGLSFIIFSTVGIICAWGILHVSRSQEVSKKRAVRHV